MNKAVVKKLVKAKMLEVEALRELISDYMPEPMKEKAETFEKEMLDIAKELFWEHMTEKRQRRNTAETEESSQEGGDNANTEKTSQEVDATKRKSSYSGQKGKNSTLSKTSRINIQFGEEEQ